METGGSATLPGDYKTLKQSAHDEFIVNKSRFIGYAAPCQSEEEALAFLKTIREKHRDATHNCYAYVIGENAGVMRYSDDGEPGGTAGLPMMEVLKSRGVVNCCVVVTRQKLLLDVPYPLWDRVSHAMKSLPVLIEDTQFGASVEATLLVRVRDFPDVTQKLTALTDAKAEWLALEETHYPWPEES